MAFYDNTTGDMTFTDPLTGEKFVINTPVENYTWNSTPLTWTSSSTADNSSIISSTSNSNSSEEVTGTTSSKRGRWWTPDVTRTITTTTSTDKQKRIVHTSDETKVSKTVSTATTANTSLIPFMRARIIDFKISGLKPNAKLTATFADEDVTELCEQTMPAGQKKGNLKASPTGTIEGKFYLPGNRFKAGAKALRVFDSEDPTLTWANATYVAAGTRVDINKVTTQHTVTTKQRTVHDMTFNSTETSQSQRTETTAGRWVDPVAQSFFVETSETNRGVFIHSIDLYFFEAEPQHDVRVEVRKMRDGAPTIELLADYAKTSLPGNAINTSVNGSRHTRFTFPTPFFVPPGDEYCFVVLSNSSKTSLWCSELGKKAYRVTDTVEPTGEMIAKQPYLGSMFISQNNTTWTPQQTKDLKFRINRADFKKSGRLKFINKPQHVTASPHNKRVKPDSLEFKSGSNEVTLYLHGHGLRVDDTFQLLFGPEFVKQLTVFGINIANELNQRSLRVTESHPTHVKFKTVTKANGSGSAGGEHIYIIGWKTAFSYLQLVKNDLQLDGTTLNYKFSGREWLRYNDGVSGSYAVPENQIMELPKIYSVKEPNDGGVTIDIEMAPDPTGFTSPTIYADSLGVETHLNVVNEIDFMDSKGTVNLDSSPAKYIQKEVSLITPANELKVFFESSLPYGSTASVYYQVGGEELPAEAKWTKMVANKGDGIVPSASEDEWRTQKFEVTGLDDFKSFRIMIVLQSQDRLVIPRIKNYRAISLYGI